MRRRRLPVVIDLALATRLRVARERAGLSQREAAERIDTSQSMVCVWEAGRREPTLTGLRQLAALYGTTAAALIAGDNSTGTGKRRTVASMTTPRRARQPGRAS